jgi:hypothetical protein
MEINDKSQKSETEKSKWDALLNQTQDHLLAMAEEALKEYKDGKASDKPW